MRQTRTRQRAASAAVIKYSGGRDASSFNERREAFRHGKIEVPDDGHVICQECYRVVRVRVSDGLLYSHKFCPGGGTAPR